VGLTEREGAALMWALGHIGRGQPFGDVLPQVRRKIETLSRQRGERWWKAADVCAVAASPHANAVNYLPIHYRRLTR
jgi:hypothetical protein